MFRKNESLVNYKVVLKEDNLSIFNTLIDKKLNSYTFRFLNKYFSNSDYIKSFKIYCQGLFLGAIRRNLVNISYACVKNKRFSKFIEDKDFLSEVVIESININIDFFNYCFSNYKDKINYNNVRIGSEGLKNTAMHYIYNKRGVSFSLLKGFFETEEIKIKNTYIHFLKDKYGEYVELRGEKSSFLISDLVYQALYDKNYSFFDILYDNKEVWDKVTLESKLRIIREYSEDSKDIEPDMVIKMIRALLKDSITIPEDYLVGCFSRFIIDEWFSRYESNIDLIKPFEKEVVQKLKETNLDLVRKEAQAAFLNFILKEEKPISVKRVNKI